MTTSTDTTHVHPRTEVEFRGGVTTDRAQPGSPLRHYQLHQQVGVAESDRWCEDHHRTHSRSFGSVVDSPLA